jgi:hypothetical protein
MPCFSTDADLLALEPGLFADLPLAGQRKLAVTDAALDGATITSASGGFAAVLPGDVALLQGVPHPVGSVAGDTELTLARTPSGLASFQGLKLEVRTFQPQAALLHDELLRAVGIDADDPAGLGESAIVSVGLMRRLEALGTAARAYAAAVAPVARPDDLDSIRRKAADYHQRFARALIEARVLIDLDGDGRADVWRSPGVARLVRA